MTLRGVVGRVEWGYFTAAAIEGYTVTVDEFRRWSLSARVIQSDPFKISRRPLQFVAPHATGTWTWPIRTLELEHGILHATLGEPR